MWPKKKQLVPSKYAKMGREAINVGYLSPSNIRTTLTHLALKDADKKLQFPHQINQYMDYKSTLRSFKRKFFRPGHTMEIDSDLIMSHHYLKKQSKHTIIEEWVMGHARKKMKDRPKTITPLEEDNSECNSDAEDCIFDGDTPTAFQPFTSYKAMLKLNRWWTTTQFRNCVKFANVSPPMVDYIKGCLNIDDTTRHFNQLIVSLLARYIPSTQSDKKVRTSKMMYRWLPVGHNWIKCNLKMEKCTCCGAKDEIFEHLLLCKHDDLNIIRKAAYNKIQKNT